jgi:hypothetical protein
MDTAVLREWIRTERRFGQGKKTSTSQFLHIARACERLPQDTLIDGETVVLDENGRISFNLLQHHRSKAQNVPNRRGLLLNFTIFGPGYDIESPRRCGRAGFLHCARGQGGIGTYGSRTIWPRKEKRVGYLRRHAGHNPPLSRPD